MKNTELKLHLYQKQIFAKLAKSKGLRFNSLLSVGLESEHVNYHLKRLIEFGLVKKVESKYSLTILGKDYSGLMDDNSETIEKQPKSSIMLRVVRKNKKGQVEHLMAKRLKQPYLGKIGLLTGKIQFGETIEGAARRELFEETGLEANEFALESIYHKLRYNKNEEYVQDNIFYIFFVKNPFGDFVEKTKHQENLWLTQKDVEGKYKNDVFEGTKLDNRFDPLEFTFIETDKITSEY